MTGKMDIPILTKTQEVLGLLLILQANLDMQPALNITKLKHLLELSINLH